MKQRHAFVFLSDVKKSHAMRTICYVENLHIFSFALIASQTKFGQNFQSIAPMWRWSWLCRYSKSICGVTKIIHMRAHCKIWISHWVILRRIAILLMWIFPFYIDWHTKEHPWAGAVTIRRAHFDFKEIAYQLTASIQINTAIIHHRNNAPMDT